MIKQFKNLSKKEKELLLKAPILVSVLAASGDHEISRKEKADAIKLAHLQTFMADPILLPYYNEVEKLFTNYFEVIVKQYSPFDEAKREGLKIEIIHLNSIIEKLDKEFAKYLKESLSKYAEHVRKAERSIFVDFLFPVSIPGLTE